jgi:hypothetical protein
MWDSFDLENKSQVYCFASYEIIKLTLLEEVSYIVARASLQRRSRVSDFKRASGLIQVLPPSPHADPV